LAQAEKHHSDLMAAVVALANSPVLGRDCSHIRAGYRRYNVGSHVVFYRAEAVAIQVMRILHKSQDFPRHL
jgi:toxin ParE1/3/4